MPIPVVRRVLRQAVAPRVLGIFMKSQALIDRIRLHPRSAVTVI
jgi:hypothetical protein